MFSPVNPDTGYPARIWDKLTGEINKTVAKYWQDNFDLQHILQRDWHKVHVDPHADQSSAKGNQTLGQKLQGKIHLFVGQSDTYYLNDAVYFMETFLKSTSNPHYDGGCNMKKKKNAYCLLMVICYTKAW